MLMKMMSCHTCKYSMYFGTCRHCLFVCLFPESKLCKILDWRRQPETSSERDYSGYMHFQKKKSIRRCSALALGENTGPPQPRIDGNVLFTIDDVQYNIMTSFWSILTSFWGSWRQQLYKNRREIWLIERVIKRWQKSNVDFERTCIGPKSARWHAT